MKFATVYNIMAENKLVQWHIFVILIVSCISTLVAPSNLSIIQGRRKLFITGQAKINYL